MNYFKTFSNYNNKIVAAICMIIATTLGVFMITLIKYVQADLNVFTISFFRFFFGLIIIIPYHYKTSYIFLKTKKMHLHIFRSLFNVPAMYFGFSAVYLISLEKNAAISFTTPIIVSILAILFLKERIYLNRIFSLILGFIGNLIVVRPGIIELEVGVLFSLFSCFFWSISVFLTKKLSETEEPITILSYMYIFMTTVTLIFAIIKWDNPNLIQLTLLFFAATCGTILHLFLNYAYKISDLTFLMPFNYIGLIVSSLMGFFIFEDYPDIFSWIGGGIILFSVYWITSREKNKEMTEIRN